MAQWVCKYKLINQVCKNPSTRVWFQILFSLMLLVRLRIALCSLDTVTPPENDITYHFKWCDKKSCKKVRYPHTLTKLTDRSQPLAPRSGALTAGSAHRAGQPTNGQPTDPTLENPSPLKFQLTSNLCRCRNSTTVDSEEIFLGKTKEIIADP